MIIWDDLKWAEDYFSKDDIKRYSSYIRFPRLHKRKLSIYAHYNNISFNDLKNKIETQFFLNAKKEIEELYDDNFSRYLQESMFREEAYDDEDYDEEYYEDDFFDDEKYGVNYLKKILEFEKSDFKANNKQPVVLHDIQISKSDVNWCITNGKNNNQRRILYVYLFFSRYFNFKWMYELKASDVKRLAKINPNNHKYKKEFNNMISNKVFGWWYLPNNNHKIGLKYLDEQDEILFTVTNPEECINEFIKYLPKDICTICGEEFERNSNRQKVCSNCKQQADNLKAKERMKLYRYRKKNGIKIMKPIFTERFPYMEEWIGDICISTNLSVKKKIYKKYK